MDWEIYSSTHHIDGSGDRVTRKAHMWVPESDAAPRLYCVQADILNAPSIADSHATGSILIPGCSWAQVMSVPAREWRSRMPTPTGRENDSKIPMDHYAAWLLSRCYDMLCQGIPASLSTAPPR